MAAGLSWLRRCLRSGTGAARGGPGREPPVGSTWVNGAAVSTYGTVEQTTIDEIRRIIEVDLLGTIYGMKAALPYLRQTGGALINISSVTGKRAVPLQATYSAAKHGIVGFSEALRMELEHERASR